MRRFFKNIGFALSLLFLTCTAVAQQQFPVKVEGSVVFPSTFIKDYEVPENYRLLLRLNDVSEFNYRVNLKVEFKSSGFSFSTTRGVDLTLDGGITYTLDAADLGVLFDPTQLTSTVASGQAPNTGAIREGVYEIIYTVVDAVVPSIVVNNPATDFTVVAILQNEPPLLNMPENGSELDSYGGNSSIMFSWIPRNIAVSPNNPIKYELELIKVFPSDMDPYQAMLSAESYRVNLVPFTDIPSPVFIYDPTNFELEKGATYAWRVRAYEEVIDGGQTIKSSVRFTNGGLSEVFYFTIKEECDEVDFFPPAIINTTEEDLIKLDWADSPEHQMFEIQYRPMGSVLPWTVIQQQESELSLPETTLLRGTTYEYTVTPKCTGWQPAQYGGEFKLPTKTCTAPTPITVVSNDENGIVLNWDAIPQATDYTVTYSLNGVDSTEQTVTTGLPTEGLATITLPKIEEGFYTVQVDGVCGGWIAFGKENQLNFNETTVVGDCPIPTPFSLLALREGDLSSSNVARLNWPYLEIHTSFEITYWHRDSTNYPKTNVLTIPELITEPILDDQLYKFTIKYTCEGGKEATTPEAGFRINGGAVLTSTEVGTADCFPPAVLTGEAKDLDKARFEWSKVSEAEEYQVFYWLDPNDQDFEVFTTTSRSGIVDQLPTGVYKFKIRCKCNDELSIFSEIGSVNLANISNGSTCDSLLNFTVTEETPTEIQLTWNYPQTTENGDHTGYLIKYKTESQTWDDSYLVALPDWNVLTTEHVNAADNEMRYTVNQLDNETTYDFSIKAVCGDDFAKENTPIQGTTLPSDDQDCASGECDRTSTNPLLPEGSLAKDDVIDVSDYALTIREITHDGNGYYSGVGIAEMPLVGMTDKVNAVVKFERMFVNDNNCMTEAEMEMELTLELLDPELMSQIQNIEGLIRNTLDSINNIITSTQQGLDSIKAAGNEILDYFQGGATKGMPLTGGLGVGITVSGATNGATINDPSVTGAAKPVLIQNETGQVFTVGTNNVAVLVGVYDSTTYKDLGELPVDNTIEVTFEKNSNAIYFFDEYIDAYGEKSAMAPHYLTIGDKGYSAKAITHATIDVVDFQISGGGDKRNLKFINGEGFVYNYNGSNRTLSLVGGPAKDAQVIYAVYNDGTGDKNVGMLLLSCYERKEKKVVIVPIKSSSRISIDAQVLQDKLNDIYGRVGINYTVEVDDSFKEDISWCSNAGCTFTPEGSAALSNNYTGDEKSVMDAYITAKGADNLDADAAYLFAVGVATPQDGDEQLQGKMNFGEQFGFLYNANSISKSKMATTLAHELGHGNYKLYHMFESMYLGESARNGDNVMSYGHGDFLNKLQWDIVHQPGVNWGIFNRDKDQEMFFDFYNLGPLLSAIKNNKTSSDFVFDNTNNLYFQKYWTTYPVYSFEYEGQKHIIDDVSMQLGTPVDLRSAVTSYVIDDYDDLKVVFKDASRNDILGEFDFLDFDAARAFLKYLGYQTNALESQISTFKTDLETIVKTCWNDSENCESDKAANIINLLDRKTIESLTNEIKVKSLYTLPQGAYFDDSEGKAAVKVVEYCKTEELGDLHSKLINWNVTQGDEKKSILQYVCDRFSGVFDDSYYPEFITCLIVQTYSAYLEGDEFDNQDSKLNVQFINAQWGREFSQVVQFFPVARSRNFSMIYLAEFKPDGDLSVVCRQRGELSTTFVGDPFAIDVFEKSMNPFTDFVYLTMYSDGQYIPDEWPKLLPAITLKFLNDGFFNASKRRTITTAGNAIALISGAGVISTGLRGWKLAAAYIEVGAAFTSISTDVLAEVNVISPELAEDIQFVTMVAEIASFSIIEVPELIVKFPAAMRRIGSKLNSASTSLPNLSSNSLEKLRALYSKALTKMTDLPKLGDAVGSAKYPINNFVDFVNNTFTTAQKQSFNKAKNFYKSFNPSFNANELRGIDFDSPISNVVKQEDNIMYQMATLDDAGNPRFGSYFFENVDEDITKLGIGDLNRIASDGRVKVKVVLESEVDFLKSKTVNIEDWTGSGEIFQGGGNQYYNPTARNKIKSFEILD